MAAKLLLRNLLTAIKKFALPQGLSRNLSFDSSEPALDQCSSYYIAEARRPGQMQQPGETKKPFLFNVIKVTGKMFLPVLAFVGLAASSAFAQTPVITYAGNPFTYTIGTPVTPVTPGVTNPPILQRQTVTFAGSYPTATAGFANGTGTGATFSAPTGVATDASGNIYVADKGNNAVRKITPTAVVSTLASGNTFFNAPSGIAVNPSTGDVYVGNTGNNTITKVTPGGTASAYTLTGGVTITGPTGLAIDATGTNLYIANSGRNNIVKVTISSGAATVLAGSTTGASGGTGTANGTSATFNVPLGITIDAASANLYVADENNNAVRKISLTSPFPVTNLTTTGLSSPTGVTIDASGNVYEVQTGSGAHEVQLISSGGTVTLLAGGSFGYTDGSPSTPAAFGGSGGTGGPFGVAVDASGNLFVADPINDAIRRVSYFNISTASPLPAGLSFNYATGAISGTPTAVQAATNYTITASNATTTSTGTNQLNITVAAVAPTTQATNVTFSTTTSTSTGVNWTNGNGAGRAVFMAATTTGQPSPVNGTNYTANLAFGSGTQIGASGWFCVFNGTGLGPVTVTGLAANTTYRVMTLEWNGSASSPAFLTSTATGNPANVTTLNAPTTQASNVTFTNVTQTSTTINWTNGNGSNRSVFVFAGSSGSPAPVNGTTYNANTVFGSGDQIGATGWYCVYSGTGATNSVAVTGLTQNTTYRAMVVEWNTTGTATYLTTTNGTNPANVTTPLNAPTTQASNIVFSATANTTTTISWTNGNGAQRAVFVLAGASGTPSPVNGTVYTPNTTFGAGSQAGAGWFCVFNGTGSTVNVTGLTANTTYQVMVVELNTATNPQYNTTSASGNPASLTTTNMPQTQATNITFTNVTPTNGTINWTSGNGAGRAVFVLAGTTGSPAPVNGTTYNANTAFGSGDQIGSSGWYCVFNGISGNSVAVTGLSPGTTYRVMVVEWNTAGGLQYNTNTATNNPNNVTTPLNAPTTQATNVTFSPVGPTTSTISWTNGNGSQRAVFVFAGASGTPSPVNGTVYTANTAFGSGTQAGAGWYCVFNGTGSTVNVTGLTANTTYQVMVVELNTSTNPQYNTTTATGNPNSVTTPLAAPTTQASIVTFTATVPNSATVNWTNGNGQGRAVFMLAGTTGTPTLTNGTVYTANTAFGSGQTAGAGWFCIYNGTGTGPVTVTGLTANTTYRVMAVEWNTSTNPQYITTTNGTNPANVTTPQNAPTTPASNVTFSATTATTSTISWTNGNGSQRAVFVMAGASGTPSPVNGTVYTANTAFGSGTQIGSSGWFCVFNGTGSTVNITGLTTATTYQVMVVELNTATNPQYNTSTATNNPNSFTTPSAVPTTQATNVNFINTTTSSTTINWTNGNGDGRDVFIFAGTTGTPTPVVGTNYAASTAYGSGQQAGAGWYCVYNGNDGSTSVNVTGLANNTNYRVMVVEWNTASDPQFLTTTATGNPANFTSIANPPTTQASNITFTATTATTSTISWTNGNGSTRAVFIFAGASGNPSPVNGTAYTANTAYGSGTQAGTAWYCIFNGAGTSVNVTGLTTGTTYQVMVVEYNGSSNPQYLTSTATNNPNGFTTSAAVPTTQATNVNFTNTTTSSTTINWTNGNGDGRDVFIFAGTTGTPTPVVGTNYTASTTYGSGQQAGAGWYCVYNGNDGSTSVSVTGLANNTNYRVMVVEWNTASDPQFLTTTATGNPANFTSIANPPTTQASNVTFTAIAPTSTTVSWTNGNGSARAVFMSLGTTGSPAPVNGTAYTANTVFGSGTQIGVSGWYCIFNGIGTTANVTGLTSNSGYRVMVVDYNGGANPRYLTSTATNNPNNVTTPSPAPTTQASNVTFTGTTGTTTTINWTNGNGAGRSVFVLAGTTGTPTPVNGTTYTASTTYGSGTQAGAGWYNVYNGTGTSVSITGLNANTTYRVMVLEWSTSGNPQYLTTTNATDPAMVTPSATNSSQASNMTFSAITASSVTNTWTNGTGSHVAVFMIQGTPSTLPSPTNGPPHYTASTTYGSGGQTPTGWYCIYDSGGGTTGTTIGVTGLSAGTTYTVMAVSYSSNSNPSYLTGTNTGNPNSFTTGGIAENGTLNAFSTTSGTASTPQSFAVSGSSLTNNIVITAPSGFEVSTSSGSGYGTTVTLVPASGTVASTTIYARLAASDAVGSYTGSPITIASSPYTTINVTASGTVNGTISENGTLSSFTTTFGTASASQSISVSGVGLTNDILVTAPSGFEVSLSSSSGYGSSVTLTKGGGSVPSTPVYVRLAATDAAGTYSGNPIVISSSPYTSINVTASGTVTGFITQSNALTSFSTSQGTASASQPISVTGNGLTAGILVTPPAGYEASLDNSTFSPTVTLPQAGGTVYVRLSAAASAAIYNGNVVLSSTGVPSVNVAVTGEVSGSQTITFNPLGSVPYGTSPITLTATASSNLPVSYSSDNNSVASVSGNVLTITGVGTANITASQPGDGNITAATPVIQPITVTAATQTITFGPITARTYGTADFSPGATASSGLQVSYISSNTAVATIVGNNIHIVGAGTSTITASQAGNANYSAATSVNQTLTVNKAILTITAIGPAKPYGTVLTTGSYTNNFTATGMVNGETVTSVTLTMDLNAQSATENAGTGNNYTVTPSAAVGSGTFLASNYNITYTPFTGTVAQAPVTITANNVNQTYGAALTGGAGSTAFTAVGMQNGQTITSVTMSYNTSVSTPAGFAFGLATPSLQVGGNANNYTFTYVAGTITVLPRPLTLTGITANSKTYDGNNTASFSGTPTLNNVVNGDGSTSAKLSVTVSGTFASTNAANGITVTSTSVLTGTKASNYTLTQPTFTANITRAGPIILTATGPTVRVYGTGLTTTTGTTFTSSGLVNGESITSVTLTPDAAGQSATTSAGSAYSVSPSAPTGPAPFLATNYNITPVAYTGTVTKAPLTATADNKTMVYGDPLPAFTITYATFANTDNASSIGNPPTASTTATSLSPVGTYPITLTGGSSTNYVITDVAGTLTITPSFITFNSIPSKVYGASDFDPGAKNADPASSAPITYSSDNTDVATIVANKVHITGAGTANITASNGSDTETQALTVTPATLSITANVSKTYGTTLVSGTSSTQFTAVGLVNGETIGSVTMNYGQGSAANDPVNITGYINTATPSLATGGTFDDDNYSITYNSGNIVVNPALLVVTATGPPKTYGTALTAGTSSTYFTYSGTVNNETVTSVTLTPNDKGLSASTAAGQSYIVTPSLATGDGGFLESNYTVNYVPFNGTVGKFILNVSASGGTKVYDGSTAATVTLADNRAPGDVFTAAYTSAAFDTKDIGTGKTVTVNGISIAGQDAGNYTFNTSTTNLADITTRTLTIFASNVTKVYGDALTGGTGSTAFTSTGLQSGETVGSVTIAYGAGSASTDPAGNYPGSIVASAATDGTFTPGNYSIVYKPGDITVSGSRVLTITPDNQNRIYGQGNPPFTLSYSGFVNGDGPASLTTPATVGTSATSASPVGTYDIIASGAASPNYTITYVAGSLKINPAALTISAADKSKNYGDPLPILTAIYSGFVNNDNAASLTTPPTLSATATATSPVNTYPISISGAVDDNYTISYAPGTLTVNPATLSIKANNVNKTYGATLTGVVGSTDFSSTGLQYLETIGSVSIDYGQGAAAADAVGTYTGTVTPSSATGGTFDPNNYSITYNSGNIIVGRANLTIKANDQAKVYGTTLTGGPGSTAFTAAGLQNLESVGSVTLAYGAGSLGTDAPGVYPGSITVSAAIDGTFTAGNYNISYTPGTLTVQTTPLVFNPIPSLTYGTIDTDPGASSPATINYSSSNSNVATIVNGKIHIIGVGSSNITAVAGSTTLSQSLTVTPASLTVTADSKSKNYGAAIPPLTVSYSGFVNGDTQASLTTPATASTTATAASSVGSYAITASGAVDPNYTISYVAGTLTVNKATLTVTADNQTKVYGTANPAFTVSYSGFVNGDTKAGLTTQATVTTSATTASLVGSYDLIPGGAASSNYTFSYVNGALTVTPAGLLITANNQSKAYGAGLPPFTANYTGFVNGDTQASLTTAPTFNTTATASSPIGTYPITASGAVDPNYTISYAPGTLTVNQANLVITPNSISKVYGAAIPALTASYSGFVNGDTPASLSPQPTMSTTATAASPIGTYLITATGAANPNYNISYNTGNLTVTPATLTITANNQSKTYGAANPTLTVSYSGFVNGETRNNLTTRPTITTTATTTSPAGAYPITASGAVDPNYTFVYVPGTLTINPAVLTVTANDQSKIYGANNPTLSVIYGGFVNGDTKASLTTPATATTTATAASPVGTYPITASGAVDPNYSFVYFAGTLTVNQATLTIAANTLAKTYGSPNPALSVSYSGFVNGDTQASLLGQPIISTTAVTGSPVGNYPITASGAYSPNYNINYLQGTLIVTQVALFISADNQTKAAGSANPTLTASYSGFVNGDTQASLTTAPTLSTTATTSSPAGTYPITVSGAVDPNYSIAYANGTLTVTNTPLTFAAIPAKTYGTADFDPGATSGSPITYTSNNPAVATIVNGNIHITGVGNSVITATAGSSSLTQLLIVNPASLTIVANGVTKTYGVTLSSGPGSTAFTPFGLVNGESIGSVTVTYGSGAAASASVGTYNGSVTPTAATGGTFNANNYSITYNSGSIMVQPVSLTISANNKSKNYGSANPALTVSYSGFVNGETQANLTTPPTVTTTAATSSPVGTYPINVSGAVDANYTIAYNNGTLTVGQAALVISADNHAKTYGSVNPTLTITYSGFVNGEDQTYLSTLPNISTTATTGSAIGNYPIIVSGAASTNYSISYTAGTMTVTPAALNITADNQSKIYGAANPPLTISYSGFVNGDSQASLTTLPTAGTTASTSSGAGTYPITVSGAVDPNYSFIYNAGTLTVTPAALTITANNQTKTQGAANPPLTLSYSGYVNGDNVASLATQPNVSTTANTNSPVGSYPINVGGASDPDYTISYVQGTLTVTGIPLAFGPIPSKVYGAGDFNPGATSSNSITYTSSNTSVATIVSGNIHIIGAGSSTITANDGANSIQQTLNVTTAPLTITANNASKTYGAANPSLSVSYSGFVNSDTQANLTTQPTVATTATTGSAVGTYPIIASGAASNNYSIAYNGGTLTVGQASLTATANNQSKTYGSANPILTVGYSGFVNGDNSSVVTTPATVTTAAGVSSPVGSYPITASGAAATNYSFSYVQGTLTVGQAPLTITADNQTKVQGTANPPLTVSYNGFVNGDTKANLTTLATATTTATTGSPVGTYPITASGAVDANYSMSYVQGTLTVTGSLTFNPIPSKVYGTADFSPGATSAGGAITYTSGNTSVATIVSGNIHIVGVGTSTITANNGTTSLQQTLTVTPAALTATANNASKTYGAANPALSVGYSGFVNGENSSVVTTQATVTTTATTSSPVGSYPITASGAVAANYSISYVQGTMTVNQAALTITANNQTKVQGAANPTLTVSYSGFVNGETNTALTTQPTVTTTATTASPVGTYPITASGAVDANYTISYVAGTLTVTAANTLTFNAIPSKVYGTADFNPGATTTTGSITYTSSNTAVATIVSGNIHIVGVGTSSITASNGTSSLQQTLTVTRAALTITANNASKTYGAANPALSVSYSGFINGETNTVLTTQPTVTTTAVAGSPVGSYPITASGAVAANYSISYVQGTMTVNQAALTITANNQTKVQGAANPTLTVSYSGFVNGETNTALTTQPTVTTTATTASPVGTYPITASGAVDANYAISYVAGTLTVTAANTLTFNPIPSKVYGTANFNPGATTTTGSITYTSSNTAVATIVSGNIHIVGVGTSTITASNGTSSLQQTLTVTRAALTITANNVNKTYGATLTGGAGSTAFTSTGLVNGQTIGSVTIAYGTGSAATAAVATYTGTVTPSAATGGTFKASNYTITYNSGNIVVGRAQVMITADNKTKVRGTANPPLTITYSGFVNGQTNSVLTTQPTITTTAKTNSPVGSYPITVSGAAAANYSFSYVQGTMTVTASLTFNAIASKTYGASDFSGGATSTAGPVTYTSDNSAVATIVSGNIHIVGAGTSNITASDDGSSSQQTLTVSPATLTIYAYDINKNYGGTMTPGSGSIYFTPNGLKYGQTIGSVTIAYGPAVATTTSVGTYSNQVTVSAAAGGTFTPANYNITYIKGAIIVNKKVLIVTAANKSKNQGTANPALTITYSGFANGETNSVLTAQPVASTTATISSPAGNYPITANGAAANNYSFTYVQGTLTINNPSNATIISVNNPEHVTYVPVDEPVVRQAVSPNGDGINDVLHIDNIESYPDNKVMLMNRNGTTIYEMTGYDNVNKVFDGHSNITKQMQQPGTYFYMIEYKVQGGEVKRKTGYFIIKY